MNLLEWFICSIANNQKKFSPKEQEELDVLIKRIKIELHSDSKGVSTRSGKHQLKRLDQDPTDDGATSLQNSQSVDENDEMEINVSEFEESEIFLALVKIYLKDARQMNLSVESFNADPSKQEPRFDNSNEKIKNLVTGVEQMDLNLQPDLITGEKNVEEEPSAPEPSPTRTTCENASNEVSSTPVVESSRKIRQIRQELKNLAYDLLTFDRTASPVDLTPLGDKLKAHLSTLTAIECHANERLDAARASLIEYAGELTRRLEQTILSSSSCEPEYSSKRTASESLEAVLRLVERIDDDLALYMFDSRSDPQLAELQEKLVECLHRLRGVRCDGDQRLLAVGKETAELIDQVSHRCNAKVLFDSFLLNDIEDATRSITQEEALERIRRVESLAEILQYLMSCADNSFWNLDEMLVKCRSQLASIECPDEQLEEQLRVADYVTSLIAIRRNAEGFVDLNSSDESSAVVLKSLQTIRGVEEECERLKCHIDFGAFVSRADRTYLYVEETLTKLLISLDSIDCDGNERLRAVRKKAVLDITRLTECLEAKVPS